MFNKVCIVGVGLIGGSLARAMRAKGLCKHITGCGRKRENLEKAQQLGVIDDFQMDVTSGVKGADLIVVATPLGAMADAFVAMRAIVDQAIITDVGSAKASVVASAQRAFGKIPANLVPGHPIAGTENSGVEASFATLFEKRRVILTPLAETNKSAIAKVRLLWEQVGANVSEMSVAHHDEVLAATSHLPHVLAFALVDALSHLDESHEIFTYAAGGFRDFTRIASSDPVMWRDICLDNKAALLRMLDLYERELKTVRQAIQDQQGDTLMRIFSRAKQARDEFKQD